MKNMKCKTCDKTEKVPDNLKVDFILCNECAEKEFIKKHKFETVIGKELEELAKEVQLSRYMILDYEIILLTDQELRILVKNKYKILGMI